jgi:hypothetical protein
MVDPIPARTTRQGRTVSIGTDTSSSGCLSRTTVALPGAVRPTRVPGSSSRSHSTAADLHALNGSCLLLSHGSGDLPGRCRTAHLTQTLHTCGFPAMPGNATAPTVPIHCPITEPATHHQTNKNPAFAGLFYRGARIRTGDLADPNGARYQAAPRPDAGCSIPYWANRFRPTVAGRALCGQRGCIAADMVATCPAT